MRPKYLSAKKVIGPSEKIFQPARGNPTLQLPIIESGYDRPGHSHRYLTHDNRNRKIPLDSPCHHSSLVGLEPSGYPYPRNQ
jgi:hypothetical protein